MKIFIVLEKYGEIISGVFFNGVKNSYECLQKMNIICNALKKTDLFAAERTSIIETLVRNIPNSCACAERKFFITDSKQEEVENYCKRNNINYRGNNNYVPISGESISILKSAADKIFLVLLPENDNDKVNIPILQFFEVEQGYYETKKPWEIPRDEVTGMHLAAKAYHHIVPKGTFETEFPKPYACDIAEFEDYLKKFPSDCSYFIITDRDIYLTDFSKIKGDYYV